MSDKIICRINDTPKIICKINDIPKIIVKFGDQGLMGPMGPTGPMGTTDHSLLTRLGFSDSGHTGFQKLLVFIPEYHAYEIE